MAVDFNILARVPTIGSQIMAGQEAGREAAARNMLLQQRQLEFEQAQEERKLAMEERRMQQTAAAAQVARRGQLAQVLRQSGMDPSDMQSATQFYAAALEANEPTAIAAAKDWLSIARETAQSRAAGAEYQGIMGGAPAPAPRPAAVAAPMPPVPVSPAGANVLAPQAAVPPVNQLAAAPAPTVGPTPAPAKEDPAALRAEAQRLEGAQQRLRQSPFEKNQKRAQELDKPIERLLKRADDIEKAAKPSREALSPLGRLLAEQSTLPENDPRRAAYAAAIEKESQRPDRETPLAQLIRERDALTLTDPRRPLYNDAIKKATTQPPPVEVKLPPQEGAFEIGLGRGQSERILKDQEVAQDARSIIDTVQQGRQLLQSGMITGFGAEALTQIGAALNQAGISFASDSVANTQAFAANMAQNVGRIIKQFGAGTGLSNADREYAEKMAGGKITLDRAAIERILDINERAARNVITAHNKRVANIKTNVPLTVELPPAMPTAPAAPAGRPSLEQIFQPPKR